jgi:hypothetical protein
LPGNQAELSNYDFMDTAMTKPAKKIKKAPSEGLGGVAVLKPRKLTAKRKKLIKGIAEGKTQRQAAKEAGLNECHASTILKEPQVIATIQSLMAKHGLDDDSLLIAHKELINATKVVSAVGNKDAGASTVDFIDVPDFQARAKGIEMAYKLKGAFVDKKEVTFPEGLSISVAFVDPHKQGKK